MSFSPTHIQNKKLISLYHFLWDTRYLIHTKSDAASKSRKNCIFIQDTILFIFNQRDGQFCNIFIALANWKWKTFLMLKTNKIIEDIQILLWERIKSLIFELETRNDYFFFLYLGPRCSDLQNFGV